MRRKHLLSCVVVQRTFEFKTNSNKKVKEDVGVDVEENYVLYHLKDDESGVWVIDDFNRVSVGFTHLSLSM